MKKYWPEFIFYGSIFLFGLIVLAALLVPSGIMIDILKLSLFIIPSMALTVVPFLKEVKHIKQLKLLKVFCWLGAGICFLIFLKSLAND